MHKIDRSAVPHPICLNQYNHPAHRWDNLNAQCKREIRESVIALSSQQNAYPRCAYCEGPVYHEGHIEHFRRKKKFPELTFEWENLFFSCDGRYHCGHYKDRKDAPPYNPDNLIKPDIDDPDNFLYFSSNGEVWVRNGLNKTDAERALKTIDVFGLNDPVLVANRKKSLDQYKKDLDLLLSFFEERPEDTINYINNEIEENKRHPYSTTIKHFFLSIIQQ